jgi:two-component system sensor histidine kinase RegB
MTAPSPIGTPWYLGATSVAALPWRIRLRVVDAAIAVTIVMVSALLPAIDFPLRRLWVILVMNAGVHVVVAAQLGRSGRVSPALAITELILQVVLLTGLLELTGGPFNPFAVVYAVPIAIAALSLGRLYGVAAGMVAAAGYGLLMYWHLTETVPGHHRLNDFPTHLVTMWMALALTSELVVYFIAQASNALAQREQQLEAMRRRATRTERLVAMTTLAAGAAHELSTPLATIALAARELERSASARGTVPDLAEDARLIRAEVDRCRAILDQMSGRAGGMAVDTPELVHLDDVFNEIRSRLGQEDARRLRIDIVPGASPIVVPRGGFTQAVFALVKNAFDATAGDPAAGATPVSVHVMRDAEGIRVLVRDNGPGMTPDLLQRVGEPFYTTKDPGRGLGLGLFLVRAFAERLGGTLMLDADDGTCATLELPLAAAVAASHE